MVMLSVARPFSVSFYRNVLLLSYWPIFDLVRKSNSKIACIPAILYLFVRNYLAVAAAGHASKIMLLRPKKSSQSRMRQARLPTIFFKKSSASTNHHPKARLKLIENRPAFSPSFAHSFVSANPRSNANVLAAPFNRFFTYKTYKTIPLFSSFYFFIPRTDRPATSLYRCTAETCRFSRNCI